MHWLYSVADWNCFSLNPEKNLGAGEKIYRKTKETLQTKKALQTSRAGGCGKTASKPAAYRCYLRDEVVDVLCIPALSQDKLLHGLLSAECFRQDRQLKKCILQGENVE